MSQIVTISIEKELQTNPSLKKSDIDVLREWCKTQPHLPPISYSDLIIFLHSNYYSIEPTKTTIDSYYTLKTCTPEFFAGRDPLGNKEIRKLFHVTSAIPLKQLTKEGYHIILLRFTDPDASKYVFNDNIKLVLMAVELWLHSSGLINGHILLYDVQNFSMGHVTRISPAGLKKFFGFLQDGLPVRLKGLHIINGNTAVNLAVRMAKPFMKKELTEMLHAHPTLESMSKFIPIEALPNELGGSAGPIGELYNAELKKLEDHRDWFLEEELRSRVDESKRPKTVTKKVKSDAKHSELVESFKSKLEID